MKITNPELLEAIAKMRANYNNQTQNDVINTALRSTFLVPAVVDNKTRIVADENNQVHFDDTPQAKFLLVNHSKLGTYIPVFTDQDKIGEFKADEPFQSIAMRFNQVASLVEQMPNVKGFVVNPLTDPLPFTKDMLDTILKQIIEQKKKIKEAKAAENKIEQ